MTAASTYLTQQVNVSAIVPPHEVRDSDKLATITASMEREGWRGRPLLVIETPGEHYQALTGSHRIQAAYDAGLEDVPCLIVTPDALEASNCNVRYHPSLDTHLIHDEDGYMVSEQEEIKDLLQRINLSDAAVLMQEEIDHG